MAVNKFILNIKRFSDMIFLRNELFGAGRSNVLWKVVEIFILCHSCSSSKAASTLPGALVVGVESWVDSVPVLECFVDVIFFGGWCLSATFLV